MDQDDQFALSIKITALRSKWADTPALPGFRQSFGEVFSNLECRLTKFSARNVWNNSNIIALGRQALTLRVKLLFLRSKPHFGKVLVTKL